MEIKELKNWALANGVEVVLPDGSSFNSSKVKLAPPRPKATQAPPAPPAATTTVVIPGIELIAKLLKQLLEAEAKPEEPAQEEKEDKEDEPKAWSRIKMRVNERDAGGNIRELEIWRVS